jgi:hypothetical protein
MGDAKQFSIIGSLTGSVPDSEVNFQAKSSRPLHSYRNPVNDLTISISILMPLKPPAEPPPKKPLNPSL